MRSRASWVQAFSHRVSRQVERQTDVRCISTLGKSRESLPESSLRKTVLQLLFGQGQLCHQQVLERVEVPSGKRPSKADRPCWKEAGGRCDLHRWFVSRWKRRSSSQALDRRSSVHEGKEPRAVRLRSGTDSDRWVDPEEVTDRDGRALCYDRGIRDVQARAEGILGTFVRWLWTSSRRTCERLLSSWRHVRVSISFLEVRVGSKS